MQFLSKLYQVIPSLIQFLSNLSKIIPRQKNSGYNLIDVDIISFFVASKSVKKSKKVHNRRRKNSYLLRDFKNFNKIFGKNVTYATNNQKSYTLSSDNMFYIYIQSNLCKTINVL